MNFSRSKSDKILASTSCKINHKKKKVRKIKVKGRRTSITL
jgi:hypothetical protein